MLGASFEPNPLEAGAGAFLEDPENHAIRATRMDLERPQGQLPQAGIDFAESVEVHHRRSGSYFSFPMSPVTAGAHHYAEYGAIALLGILMIVVVFAMMQIVRIITRVLSRIQDTDAKKQTYECGEEPIGPAWFRFNNRFYLVAILFLVFDVEVALLMPVLSRYTTFLGEGTGGAAFAKIFLFAGTLALGLVYAVAKGDISWNKSIKLDEGDRSDV